MQKNSTWQLLPITLILTLLVLAWDVSGLDLSLARWSGGPSGFALKDHWFLVNFLHDGVKKLAWLLLLSLCLAVWWPPGRFGSIDISRRMQIAVTALLAAAAVVWLKSFSAVSCPWDLKEFGGQGYYQSHWANFFHPDGGSGACFPAGHAVNGFAFIGSYFALRHAAPKAARWCLAAAIAVGFGLGLAQQLRGAHFMSHTLWSGLLCWYVALAVDAALSYAVRAARQEDDLQGKGPTAAVRQFAAGLAHRVKVRSPILHKPVWPALAASLWMGTAANLALWQALERLQAQGSTSRIFALSLALIISAVLASLLNLLAWRWTLKPAVILLLLTSSLGACFMLSYRIVIDPTMLINVLRTDSREVADLLSSKLLVTVLVLGLLPSILVWRWRVDFGPWQKRVLQNLVLSGFFLLTAIVLVVASFGPLSSAMRNNHELRYLINPLNSLYAAAYVAAKPPNRDDLPLEPRGLDAKVKQVPGARPPLLMLVLGETARSGNFGVNGYPRNTTPELASQDIVSFTNAWSCGTSTAASVPCMFSGLRRTGFEARTRNAEGLLDVVAHAGMAVLWLDNQSGCQGVCARVGSVSTANLKHPTLCPGNECFDGILLEDLDARIAALPADKRNKGVVLVLHQMGSHGPAYHRRSPATHKRFLPECTDNYLQNCSQAELVNAYDNSIAYTDHVLASAIDWLKLQQASFDPAMMYVSDHGESLGENNLYLHGLPWMVAPDVQKHVPWITWMSPAFAQRNGLSSACLKARANMRLTHDHYFSSVLGLLAIQTDVYQSTLDAYAMCKSQTTFIQESPAV